MAKNFILQLASLATLFASIPAFIVLIFSIINLVIPDAADSVWQAESARDSIRFSIATLVIFFPAYLYITRLVNKARREEGTLYHTLTKWVIYIALLIAGLFMLGDLVAIVLRFLEGELTMRFILKALSMLVIIGAAFWYYTLDAKGYWHDHEKKSVRIGWIALFVVLGFVVYGFTLIETPQAVREQRLDQQQISDLQNIQFEIESYYDREGTLPPNLATAFEIGDVPAAPGERERYSYEITGSNSYELCATFAEQTPPSERQKIRPMLDRDDNVNNYNWNHDIGRECFERTVVVPE